jgi:hypothetical protein
MIQVADAQPDGYQANAPKPSATGQVWANGGGWAATGDDVEYRGANLTETSGSYCGFVDNGASPAVASSAGAKPRDR